MIEVREKLKNLTKDWKGAKNLHKHAQAAILPTDAFKLQISAQKKGASPCVGKHSCTSSEKNVFSRSIENKPVNCKLCIKGKQKRYFVWRFQNYMDPCAYLSKWSRYAPACVQVLFAVGLKARFSFISALFLIKCTATISFNQKLDSIKT